MNRRFKTELTERHLDYNLDYDSIVIEKEEPQHNHKNLFSLQFYQKQQPNPKPQKKIRQCSRQALSSLKKAQAIYTPLEKHPRIHAQPAFRIKPQLNFASKPSLHTPSTRLYDSQHPSGVQTPLEIKIPFSKIQAILSSVKKHQRLQIDFNKFKKSVYI